MKDDDSRISSAEVIWQLREGNVWKPTGTPPVCPDPLVLIPPLDISKVSGILYPGQPRDGFKPHGAFRFNNQTNEALVTIPMDAQLVRGSRAFRRGENQYSFEFIAPCGIMYTLGHLLELEPKFLTIADKLPLVEDGPNGKPPLVQVYDITPTVAVVAGERVATKVGYAKDHNVFFDFGVFDLRHKNGVILRPEWAQFQDQFDEYGVCWLDLFSEADRNRLRDLHSTGDHVYGNKSDYCLYPENQ